MASGFEKGAARHKAYMAQKESAGLLEPHFMEADAQSELL